MLLFTLFDVTACFIFIFQPQKLSSDVFEGLSDDIGDVVELEPVLSSSTPARSSSQGSLFSLDDSNDKENSLRGRESLTSIPNNAAIRQENKNRLSFKLVRQMKVKFWITGKVFDNGQILGKWVQYKLGSLLKYGWTVGFWNVAVLRTAVCGIFKW